MFHTRYRRFFNLCFRLRKLWYMMSYEISASRFKYGPGPVQMLHCPVRLQQGSDHRIKQSSPGLFFSCPVRLLLQRKINRFSATRRPPFHWVIFPFPLPMNPVLTRFDRRLSCQKRKSWTVFFLFWLFYSTFFALMIFCIKFHSTIQCPLISMTTLTSWV